MKERDLYISREKIQRPLNIGRPFPVKKTMSIPTLYSAIDIVHGPNFYFSGESHPYWEMVYVVDGRAGITANDRLYTLTAGDLFFHKPMEFHRIWSEGGPVHVNIYAFDLEGSGGKELENYRGHIKSASVGILREISAVCKLAFSYEDNMIKDVIDPIKMQIMINLLEIFLVEVRSNSNQSLREDKDSLVFSRVVNFLKDNLSTQLTVDMIAQSCHLSASMVKKIFNKYADMGVIAYFNMLKINRAMELLDAGHNIAETSELLAFSNQFYFSTVFKKQTGCSPSEYKKKSMANRWK